VAHSLWLVRLHQACFPPVGVIIATFVGADRADDHVHGYYSIYFSQ
jgi:hypothetical protein